MAAVKTKSFEAKNGAAIATREGEQPIAAQTGSSPKVMSTNNWFGLPGGVGTIGCGIETTHGFQVTTPLLRGGNADLNMTAAMAAMFKALCFVRSLPAALARLYVERHQNRGGI